MVKLEGFYNIDRKQTVVQLEPTGRIRENKPFDKR